MAKVNRYQKLVEQSLSIMSAVGIPIVDKTPRRRERMAKALLAVAGLKPGMEWAAATSNNLLRSRDVIAWMNTFLGENLSPGSYDDIRRKDLVFAVEAGLVRKSAGKEGAATTDGTRSYALSPEGALLLKSFGSREWAEKLVAYMEGKTNLANELLKRREQQLISLKIGDRQVLLGPGKHNALQRAVIEEFLPRFGHGAEVLYVGDTDSKMLHIEAERIKQLGFFELASDKLPDVLAYSEQKNWLYLIEAVHSANPIDEMRKRILESLAFACTAQIIFITAFLERSDFRKFSKDVAWETEVWIAESPSHLIHFNGDKFLGPYTPTKS